MKPRYTFCILLLFLFLSVCKNGNAQAPGCAWVNQVCVAESGFRSSGLAIDNFGNSYITGCFMDTVDFDPDSGVYNLISAGHFDIFVSKFDSAGNFIWAKRMGGQGSDIGRSITFDIKSNNIFLTGHFSSTADFDPDTSIMFNLISLGSYDVFVSRLDTSGNFVWSKAFHGQGNDIVNSIAIDTTGTGGVYTTGIFTYTVDFDPDTGVFNLNSNNGAGIIYISKLDFDGNFAWAIDLKKVSSTNFIRSECIIFDPTGSDAVYATGSFNGTLDFDPDSLTNFNITAADIDVFILKLSTTGEFLWAKSGGGSSADQSFGLALDPVNGDVYTTGLFAYTMDFDPDTGVYNLTTSGSHDIFVWKLDSSGNFIWVRSLHAALDASLSIATDLKRNIYFTGLFNGMIDFDPGQSIYNLTSNGEEDIFICKLDTSGNFLWAKAIGSSKEDAGECIVPDALGNVYLSGWFNSPAIAFDSITLLSVDTLNPGIFIAKFSTSLITGNVEIQNFDENILLYPNPAKELLVISYPLLENKKVEIVITDITGKLIYKTSSTSSEKTIVNTKDFNDGIYLVQVRTKEFVETRKVIVTK